MSTASPTAAWPGHGAPGPASGARGAVVRHGPHAKRPLRYTPASMILGTVGEILITLGVILGLYVAWELVWTNVQAEQTQQVYADVVQNRAEYVAPKTETVGVKQTGAAPMIAQPANLEQFGFLWVPKWDTPGHPYRRSITEDVDKKLVLDASGIGHWTDSQLPGQLGNFALAAHRTTYGKPFSRIAELEPGDPIIVETDKYYFVYKVTDHDIVYPKDVQVIAPIPTHANGDPVAPMTEVPADGASPQYAYITLTSCHPPLSAAQRYIVWGVLDYWMDKSTGVPDELQAEQ